MLCQPSIRISWSSYILIVFLFAFQQSVRGQGQSVVYSTDFNNGIPSGWTEVSNSTDGGFNSGSASSLSSSYFTIPSTGSNIVVTNDDDCNCNKSNEYLITSSFNLSNYSSLHVNFKSYFLGEAYQGNTETAEFLYSTNSGTSWTKLSDINPGSMWMNQWIDVSIACGNSSVQFAFKYDDGGGWLYGLGLEDFNLFVPYSYDLSVSTLNLYNYEGLNNAPFLISGMLKNLGASTVDSLTLNYSIDGITQSDTIHNLSISPYSNWHFQHSINWNPIDTGIYTVKMWASDINGNNDQNNSNDTLFKTIEIISATAQKVTLLEQFSSSTSSPCANFNPGFKSLLDSNNANTSTGQVVNVKYQMNWPSPGNDPAYNSEGSARRTFYGVNGVPDVLVSGINTVANQAVIDADLAIPALVDLTADWSHNGSVIQCNVSANVYANLDSNLVLYIAMIENQISHNVQTNGETTFYNVFRKFMDGSNGHSMGILAKGNTYSHSTTDTITINSNPSQGSFDFWSGVQNLGIIVWLQNPITKEVIQACYASEVLPCQPPTVGQIITTDTTIQLAWSSLDAPFNVQYGESGFVPNSGSASNIVVNDTFALLSNLIPNTDYDFYITSDSCEIPLMINATTDCTEYQKRSITVIGDTEICFGDSVKLFVNKIQGGTYHWIYNGASILNNSDTLLVNSAGYYSVQILDTNGCNAYADTVAITVNVLPSTALNFSGPLEFCTGDSVIVSGSQQYTYVWNTLDTVQSLTIQTDSLVFGTVLDSNSCTAEIDTIHFNAISGPLTSNIFGDSIGLLPMNQYIYVVNQNPGNSYLWTIVNGIIASGQGTNIVSVLWNNSPNGTISVTESDSLCSTDKFLEVRTNLSLSENFNGDIIIHPNPSRQFIEINSTVELSGAQLNIFDAYGNMLLHDQWPYSSSLARIDVSNLANGVYSLQINWNGVTINRRIYVIH